MKKHTSTAVIAVAVHRRNAPGTPQTAQDLGTERSSTSDFIEGGVFDVDDVLRPIYEEASRKLGREFVYPGDEEGGIRVHKRFRSVCYWS